jgi:hypothetical protein
MPLELANNPLKNKRKRVLLLELTQLVLGEDTTIKLRIRKLKKETQKELGKNRLNGAKAEQLWGREEENVF